MSNTKSESKVPTMNINSAIRDVATLFLKFVNEYYTYSETKNNQEIYENKATGLKVKAKDIFSQYLTILKLNQVKSK